jgi:malate dehydrogenase (oxaloacetate-decarboxylating)
VIAGAGAAGIAIAQLLIHAGITAILMTDSRGILHPGREHMNTRKDSIAQYNTDGMQGDLSDAIRDADVFVGVAQSDLVSAADITTMADDAIVFALSNPIPEIMPEDAYA